MNGFLFATIDFIYNGIMLWYEFLGTYFDESTSLVPYCTDLDMIMLKKKPKRVYQ